MRHLWSLLAGVVAAPLTWLFLSTGQFRSQAAVAAWDQTGRFDTADLIGPAIFLVVAGVMLGLIGTLRWSPAGAISAGVLFVIPTVLMFVNPFTTLEAFFRPDQAAHRRFLGQSLQPWLPVENGTLLVLGALLLMATFSAQRWRRWPVLPAPIPPATDDEVVAGISALGLSGEQQTAGATTSTPPTSTPPRSTPMTDDEIMAAAAAVERSETTRTPEPTTYPQPTTEPAAPSAEPPAEEEGRPGTSGGSGG